MTDRAAAEATALPRQRHWRPRWLTDQRGVEFAVMDRLDRHKSGEAGGRRATKPGAHHRHRPAGSKTLPRVPHGFKVPPKPPRVVAHPSLETIAALTEGRLARREHRRAISHLADCPDCRELLSESVDTLVEGPQP